MAAGHDLASEVPTDEVGVHDVLQARDETFERLVEEVISVPEKEKETISAKIERVLRESNVPLTVEEICYKVYGRPGARERATVHTNLHRLFEKDAIVKHPMRYSWNPGEIPFG